MLERSMHFVAVRHSQVTSLKFCGCQTYFICLGASMLARTNFCILLIIKIFGHDCKNFWQTLCTGKIYKWICASLVLWSGLIFWCRLKKFLAVKNDIFLVQRDGRNCLWFPLIYGKLHKTYLVIICALCKQC